MKKFLVFFLVLLFGYGIAWAFDKNDSAVSGRVAYPGMVRSLEIVKAGETENTANDIVTSKGYYTKEMIGEFSSIIEIVQITSSGGVELWYQVSPDNSTWFTPDTYSLDTQSGVGTSVVSFNAITTPFIRFRTNVTGTADYRVWVNGR